MQCPTPRNRRQAAAAKLPRNAHQLPKSGHIVRFESSPATGPFQLRRGPCLPRSAPAYLRAVLVSAGRRMTATAGHVTRDPRYNVGPRCATEPPMLFLHVKGLSRADWGIPGDISSPGRAVSYSSTPILFVPGKSPESATLGTLFCICPGLGCWNEPQPNQTLAHSSS